MAWDSKIVRCHTGCLTVIRCNVFFLLICYLHYSLFCLQYILLVRSRHSSVVLNVIIPVHTARYSQGNIRYSPSNIRYSQRIYAIHKVTYAIHKATYATEIKSVASLIQIWGLDSNNC